MADQLVEQQHAVVPGDLRVELALAGDAFAEGEGQLPKPQRARARGEQVDQDLEAHRRQLPHAAHERIAPDREESAHRVAQRGRHHQMTDPGGEPADRDPVRPEGAKPAALDIAAAHHHIDRLALQREQHGRQQALVVLQVAVHHRQIGRTAREHAFDAGRRQAAAADPLQTAHARVDGRDLAHRLGGAVGRVVVDEHHLPVQTAQTVVQPGDQRRDVVALIEGRHHDAEQRRAAQEAGSKLPGCTRGIHRHDSLGLAAGTRPLQPASRAAPLSRR